MSRHVDRLASLAFSEQQFSDVAEPASVKAVLCFAIFLRLDIRGLPVRCLLDLICGGPLCDSRPDIRVENMNDAVGSGPVARCSARPCCTAIDQNRPGTAVCRVPGEWPECRLS